LIKELIDFQNSKEGDDEHGLDHGEEIEQESYSH
jgi:hypothetical protein